MNQDGMNQPTDHLNKKAHLAWLIRSTENLLQAERGMKVITAETPKERELETKLKALVQLCSQYCTTV
jgi:hypothetical protein